MPSLRSARAQRRAARVRNTRIIIIVVLLLVVAVGAFFAFQKSKTNSSADTNPTAVGGGNMITTQTGLQYQDLVVGDRR